MSLVNEDLFGRTFTCDTAVPYSGMPVYATTTAGHCDLAANSNIVIGYTGTDTTPAPGLCGSSTAVAGKVVNVIPAMYGKIVEVPLDATANVAVGDSLVVGSTSGYVQTRASEHYLLGVALTANDNSLGAAGALTVTMFCTPMYL